jgi:hypothetical protein
MSTSLGIADEADTRGINAVIGFEPVIAAGCLRQHYVLRAIAPLYACGN